MSLDDDLENLAATAVSEWPEIAFSGRLDAAMVASIRVVYESDLISGTGVS